MRNDVPVGTVTFVFTDIAGSTRLPEIDAASVIALADDVLGRVRNPD